MTMFKKEKANSKLEVLREVDLFRGCSDAELKKVMSAWDQVTFPAGRVLVKEGERGAEAFVLVSGTGEVSIGGQKIAEVGPGAVIGEMALLDNGPRGATVTLTTDSELLVIEVRRFRGLLDELPSLTHKILATLSRRLREVEGILTA